MLRLGDRLARLGPQYTAASQLCYLVAEELPRALSEV